MSTSFENESHKSPEVLEQEIDAKRRSISNIVDSLESRFTPGQLIDQALSYTKGNGSEFFQNLGTTLKNNPVPTALTGLGIAWLAMNQNKPFNPGSPSSGPGLGEKISDAYHGVTSALSQAGEGLQSAVLTAKSKGESAFDHASELTHRTAESLHSSSSTLSDTAHNVSDRFAAQASHLNQAIKEQPLVLAAIGIALGAAIGAALPASRKEDQLFGKARDEAVAQVKSKGAEAYSAVKENVKKALEPGEVQPETGAAKTPTSNPAGTDLSGGLGVQS